MKREPIKNFYPLMFLEQYLMGHNGFIAGGCFKHILCGKKAKDVDIFFKNEEDYWNAVNFFSSKTVNYKASEKGKEVTEEAEWLFTYQNDNCISYKNKRTGIRIELCKSIFGTPEEVLSKFDFTIVKMAVAMESSENDSGEEERESVVYYHDDFFKHLHMKRIVIDDEIPFPISTLERTYRYAKYGYFPCKETKLKLAKAINKLEPAQIEVSESLYQGWD